MSDAINENSENICHCQIFLYGICGANRRFLDQVSLDPQGRKIRVWPGLALFLGKFLENSHNLAGYSPVIKLVKGNSGVIKK